MVIGLCTVTDGNKLHSIDVLDFSIQLLLLSILSLIHGKLSSVALFRMVIFM